MNKFLFIALLLLFGLVFYSSFEEESSKKIELNKNISSDVSVQDNTVEKNNTHLSELNFYDKNKNKSITNSPKITSITGTIDTGTIDYINKTIDFLENEGIQQEKIENLKKIIERIENGEKLSDGLAIEIKSNIPDILTDYNEESVFINGQKIIRDKMGENEFFIFENEIIGKDKNFYIDDLVPEEVVANSFFLGSDGKIHGVFDIENRDDEIIIDGFIISSDGIKKIKE